MNKLELIERNMRNFQKFQKRLETSEMIESEEYKMMCKDGIAIMSSDNKNNAIFKTLEM